MSTTQSTTQRTIFACTSHTYQRGLDKPLDAYVTEQYKFNKRDGDCAYNVKVVERALRLIAVIKGVEGLKPKSILDVGCRDGFALATFESELDDTRIVGIDIVPEFVEAARKVANEVYVMDAHALTFADKEFDYVFSSHTLEHCYDHELALREMKRLATKGLFLVVPIEPEAATACNHSHYFSTTDPLIWANMVSDENWVVTGVEVSSFSDVIITAIPRSNLNWVEPDKA